MIGRICVILVLSASFALAGPSSKPAASQPADDCGCCKQPPVTKVTKTSSGVEVRIAGDGHAQPASKPATTNKTIHVELGSTVRPEPARPEPARHDPTPATKPHVQKIPGAGDMAEKMRAAQKAAEAVLAKQARVAWIDLDNAVQEKPLGFTLFGDGTSITLTSLVDRIHKARDDKSLKALFITFTNTEMNLAQAQEVRNALAELRSAGKRTFVFANGYDTPTYIAASGATDICMLEGGEIMMPGVGIQMMFLKGLLDWVGVKADYVQIGEYKGADEEYTRAAVSPEFRGELNKITTGIYDELIAGIAKARHLSPDAVKKIIDQCIVMGKAAKEQRLVDHLLDRDSLKKLLKDELKQDVNVVENYGIPPHEKLDFSNPLALLSVFAKRPDAAPSTRPVIALIHADGVIVDGESEDSLLGPSDTIGSENIRKAFRLAASSERVKAIVLRIDSPGGSALASEVMWQAARHAAEKKPLIISVGSMAASGGYYLASSGDYIFADPSALVGSIGVVGGKFVLKGLFDKVGITTETFSRGQNADLFSMTSPFSDAQKKMVTSWMRQTYEQFTQRVMTYRKGKIKEIDKVARGRIFAARQALDLGMIDAMGGLDEAVAYAAKESGLQNGQYDVKQCPAPKTLIDILNGDGEDHIQAIAPPMSGLRSALSVDSMLRLLPSEAQTAVLRQIQGAVLLQKRPVMLMSPYVLTVK